MSMIKHLKERIKDIEVEIARIQDSCEHPEKAHLVIQYDNVRQVKCALCEKMWEVQ
jgi:hypothetical protein